MEKTKSKIGKLYLWVVILLMFVFPVTSIIIEKTWYHQTTLPVTLIGKWFLFWGIGVRLFTAGLKQVLKPGFTARDIFHIESTESHTIVRELGFANVCLGLGGLISLFMAEWRMAAAFSGGLYMGIAGVQHLVKKPVSANEILAMVSDIFIAAMMVVYLIVVIKIPIR